MATRRVLYRNAAPRPGEPEAYRSEEGNGQRTVYAAAAFRTDGKRGGNVVLITGVGGGRASALELLCNPRLFEGLAERLLAESGAAELPYFEVLIRTNTIDAVSRDPAVVGYRVLRE